MRTIASHAEVVPLALAEYLLRQFVLWPLLPKKIANFYRDFLPYLSKKVFLNVRVVVGLLQPERDGFPFQVPGNHLAT